MQAPGLLALLPVAAAQHLMSGQAPWLMRQLGGGSVDVSFPGSPPGTPAVALPVGPSGFEGQWSRLTLHVDQLVMPSPGAAAEMRPRSVWAGVRKAFCCYPLWLAGRVLSIRCAECFVFPLTLD